MGSIAYPPGPINFNAPIALTWRHAFRLWWDPLDFVTALGQTYGDVTFFRIFGYRVYLVNNPELIRQVLVTKAKSFRKVPRQMRVMRQAFGNGLLVSEGEFWLRQRRLIQPAFAARRLDAYAKIAVDLTRRMLEDWRPGEVLDIDREMAALMMGVSAKTMFDLELGREAARLGEAVRVISQTFIRETQAIFTLPDWLPLPAKRRKRWAFDEFAGVVRRAIAARRASGDDRGDLMSMLLLAVDEGGDGRGMSDEQAFHEALTILVAGNHTTSAAAVWTWYMTAVHQDAQDKMAEEARRVLHGETTAAQSEQLPFTHKVIKEALRLYPPAWSLFGREAITQVQLGSYTLPQGSWVFIYPFVTHRDGRFFPDPMKFDPERFSPEREREIPQGAYFPFGMGPHVCIGASLSTLQVALSTAAVLKDFRLRLAPGQGEPVLEPHVAIRPEGGLRMVVERRD